MKKLLLPLLSVFSLTAMDSQSDAASAASRPEVAQQQEEQRFPEGYDEEQCLLELRQLEVALELWKFDTQAFNRICPSCGHNLGGKPFLCRQCNKPDRDHTRSCAIPCKNCGKPYNGETPFLLSKAARIAIVTNSRALLYKKK
jgi:hypothetical protein